VLAVNIGVPLPPLTVAELKLHFGGTAVAGVTAQVRFTVELKPPAGEIVTVEVAEPPGVMVVGASAVAVSANDGVAITVRLAVAVWTRVPAVPVIVKLEIPAAVEVAVVTVSGALTCPPLPDATKTEAGEQLAPEGSPEQVTVTVPENPSSGFTSTT
jgi:hypothetical protein